MSRIYLSPPHMSADERALLLDAFDSNWIAPLGPHVDGFEAELAAYVGSTHAAALSSGTAGLHLALLGLGVQPSDVVLCSTFTFAATANAATYVGATPVFVDSESESWCMDASALQEAIAAERSAGRRVGAVISVDLYGLLPDYARIEAICADAGIPLVEDAAEALGSTRDGQKAGTFGQCGVFSFNGNKIITTSGGGMLVSDDEALVKHARYLATQAREPVPHYEHRTIGHNYRLSNLLAAVGRGQLSHLDERIAQRAANKAFYTEHIGGLPGCTMMPAPPSTTANHWLSCLTIDSDLAGVGPEAIRLHLEADGIEARALWKPMHMQPVFEGSRHYGDGTAERLFDTGLCLPSGSALTDDQRTRIVERVRSTPGLRA